MLQYKNLLMSAVASTVLMSAGSVAAQSAPAELPFVMADGTRTADYEAAVQSWREDAQFTVDYTKSYLGLEHAYARGLTGRGVTVGINDSGVHTDHPLFSGEGKFRGIDTGVSNWYGNNGETNPRLFWASHGTHVAGTAAGNRLENGTMFGNAFNANIVSANTNFSAGDFRWNFDRLNGEPIDSASANLLRMAQDGQIRIVNNSWGGGASPVSDELRAAILQNDVLMVFAAGNDFGEPAYGYGVTGTLFPDLRDNWLTVTNVQGDDSFSPSSNFCGESAVYCVSGPGHQIVSGVYTQTGFNQEAVIALDRPTYLRLRAGAETMQDVYLNARNAFIDELVDFLDRRESAQANNQPFDEAAEIVALGQRGALIGFLAASSSTGPDPDVGAHYIGNLFGTRRIVDLVGENTAESLVTALEAARAEMVARYFTFGGLGYEAYTGTSMAAPNISGFAALLVEQFPEYSTALITDIITSTSRDIGPEGVDELNGWGVPQMGDALNGPSALRAVREVRVAGGTKDVWTNDITDAVDRYSDIVRERNPNDIGGLTKVGGGELVLAGTASYTGPTRVEGGLLTVDGSITRSVSTVTQNGIIGGTGSLASLVADAGGVVAPGNTQNPFGTLTVTGDAKFLPGSYLWVRSGVNGDPYSKLSVQGATTLEGGNVILKADQGVWNLRTKDLRILTSAGGVTGKFDGSSSDLAFLTPSLSYTDDAVYLTLVRNDVTIASAGDNANQRAVGAALDVMTATNTSGNLALEDAILDGSFDAVRASLYSLTGEVHTSLGAVATADSQLIRDAMLERGRGEPVAGLSTPLNTRGLNFWASGVHSEGRFDGTAEQARFRTEANGFAVGIDKTVERGHFGIAYGENTSELDRHRLSSSAKTRSRHVGLYGGATVGEFALRAGGSWFETNSDTRRGVQVNAFTDRLTGDYDGDGWQAYVEGAWSRSFGATAVEPYVNYTRVDYSADVRETGGDAALSGDFSETADLLTAGIRSRTLLAGGNGRPALTLVGHLAWTENLNDDGSVFKARFADGPVFDVTGQTLSGDALQTALSVNVQTSERTAFDIGYSGSHGSEYSNNRLFGRFSVKF